MEGQQICKLAFAALTGCGHRIIRSVVELIRRGEFVNWKRGKHPFERSPHLKAKKAELFLNNYASDNGYPCPSGRGKLFEKPRLILPPKCTKSLVFDAYCALSISNDKLETQRLRYRQFVNVWNKYCPHLIIAKPGSGFCDQCAKFDLIPGMQAFKVEHLNLANAEKLYSKNMLQGK